MARSKRIQIPGLIRHVMARGNGRMSIFLDDVDYRHFVYLLGDVVESLEIECLNYCVMPNHYHATLRPTLPNFSEGVRSDQQPLRPMVEQASRACWPRLPGPLQGSDRSTGGLSAVALSLHRSESGARRAGRKPRNWEWSSYAATTGLRPSPSFLAVESVLHQFGPGERATLQARFTAHVLGNEDDSWSTEDRLRSNERILGDRAFKDSLTAETTWPNPANGGTRVSELAGDAN